jgi:hypothetical protein
MPSFIDGGAPAISTNQAKLNKSPRRPLRITDVGRPRSRNRQRTLVSNLACAQIAGNEQAQT